MKITTKARRRGFAPVAMADIAFLLLIFLIVTVSVGDMPSVDLPVFRYARELGSPRTAVVTLAPSGDLLLGGTPVARTGLAAALAGVAGPGELVVALHADAATPYGLVDSLLRDMQAGRYLRVVLMTETPDGDARE